MQKFLFEFFFDKYIYAGNLFLCGDSLPKKCSQKQEGKVFEDKDGKEAGQTEKILYYFVIARVLNCGPQHKLRPQYCGCGPSRIGIKPQLRSESNTQDQTASKRCYDRNITVLRRYVAFRCSRLAAIV